MGSQIGIVTLATCRIVLLSCFLAIISSAPQFVPVAQVQNIRTGEVIDVNAENLDINGCLVGPSGEKVCPLGAFGADGQSRVGKRKQGTRSNRFQWQCWSS